MFTLSPRIAALLPRPLANILVREGRVRSPRPFDWAECRSTRTARRMAALVWGPFSEEEMDEVAALPPHCISAGLLTAFMERDVPNIGPLAVRLESDVLAAWARRGIGRTDLPPDTRRQAVIQGIHELGRRGEIGLVPEARMVLCDAVREHTHAGPWEEAVLTVLRHLPDIGEADCALVVGSERFRRFAHPVLTMDLVTHRACSDAVAARAYLECDQSIIRRLILQTRPALALRADVQADIVSQDLANRELLAAFFEALPAESVAGAWHQLMDGSSGRSLARGISVLSPEALSAITLSEGQVVSALDDADAESRVALHSALSTISVRSDSAASGHRRMP